MDLPQLQAMNSYWKKFPPIHVLFASYVGYEGAKPKQQLGTAEDLMQFFQLQDTQPPQPMKPEEA